MLVILATIAWALVAWPALLLAPGLTPYEYTLAAGIIFTIIYLIAPLVLAVAWSLLLQGRLPTGSQMKKAGIAAIVLVVLVALAIPVAVGINWLVENTAL
jgi:hypothetical protein